MDKDTILVVTGDSSPTRGGGIKPLKVDELSVNINLFIEQMGSLLEKTPDGRCGDVFYSFAHSRVEAG